MTHVEVVIGVMAVIIVPEVVNLAVTVAVLAVTVVQFLVIVTAI
jgi:hypothetical protein